MVINHQETVSFSLVICSTTNASLIKPVDRVGEMKKKNKFVKFDNTSNELVISVLQSKYFFSISVFF